MKLALFILFIIKIVLSQAQNDDCVAPWQKVDDNICLFLNSLVKTWSHAKYLCNFYGGELLFIQNKTEQDSIQKYLVKLIKYRFNKKQFVFIDAINTSSNDDDNDNNNWIWSMNNVTLTYSNWATNNNEPNLINSNGMNCACLKLKDGLWKNCDCSLNQHFVCRKTVHRNLNMNIIITTTEPSTTTTTTTTSTSTTTTQTTTTSSTVQPVISIAPRFDFFLENKFDNIDMNSFSYDSNPSLEHYVDNEEEEEDNIDMTKNNDQLRKNNFLDSENRKIIISTRVLMNDEDQFRNDIIKKYNTEKELNNSINVILDVNERTKLLKAKSSSVGMNTLRITVEKQLHSYSVYFCPYGFGFYIEPESKCRKYRTCEDWDSNYAIFSQYECGTNRIFSMKSFKCVSSLINTCDTHISLFVPF